MNELRYLLYALCFTLAFAACGGSDDAYDDSDDDTTTVVSNNVNANDTSDDIALGRLEFPHVKGGTSKVIVHRTTGDTQYDADEVNYAVEWDCDKKSQRWSCYQLHKGYTGNYSRVVSGYLNDPNLDDDEYWDQDYFYGSGYDHGHICPNADRKYSETANMQTFYLTNMQPQYNKFNGYSGSDEGLWLRMEEKIRTWVPSSRSDTLYVCKGGTIDSEDDILEYIDDKLIVPRYFFMAALLEVDGSYSAIGFFCEQKNQYATDEDLADYAMSIDDLEERTGIDFFCNLPDDVENTVEATKLTKVWGF